MRGAGRGLDVAARLTVRGRVERGRAGLGEASRGFERPHRV